jgi:hypothetical protein
MTQVLCHSSSGDDNEIDRSRQGIVFYLLVTNWESLLREKELNRVLGKIFST